MMTVISTARRQKQEDYEFKASFRLMRRARAPLWKWAMRYFVYFKVEPNRNCWRVLMERVQSVRHT